MDVCHSLPGSSQPGSTKSLSFAWMEPLTFADVLTQRSGSVGFTTEKVGPDHGDSDHDILHPRSLSVLMSQVPCWDEARWIALDPGRSWQDSLEVPWTAVFGLLKAYLAYLSRCFLSSLTRAGSEIGKES